MSGWNDFRIELISNFVSIPTMFTGEEGSVSPVKPITMLREQSQLVLELCHFTQDLNPIWETRTLLQNLKSLSAPAIKRLGQNSCQEDNFKILVQYFFDDLAFSIRSSDKNKLQNSFLPNVLVSREGPAPLLMLLFCSLLEEAGIKAQITSCRVKYLLKVQLDDKSHIVDFKKSCGFLQPYEIVELINRGFDFSCGALNSDILVVEYLNLLKKLSRKENKLQILSMVHSYLMRYQPFNLKHLSERAIVAYETGDYRTALDDIRSYFQYKQPEFTNLDLKRIYKVALKKERQLERQITNAFSNSIKGL